METLGLYIPKIHSELSTKNTVDKMFGWKLLWSEIIWRAPEFNMKEGWRTYQLKRCELNNEDKVNSLKILSNNNYKIFLEQTMGKDIRQ